MTTLAFPSSPSPGQTYVFAGKTWAWNGTGWAEESFISSDDPYIAGTMLIGVSTINTSGGRLQLSGGITFPATEVASTDPNTLDDYEEGTWTPAFSSIGSLGTTVQSFTSNTTPIAGFWNNPCYDGVGTWFVAGGGTKGIYSTNNGVTWTSVTMPATSGGWSWTAYSSSLGLWVCLDNDGGYCTSSNAITWSAIGSLGSGNTDTWGGFVWNGSVFCAVSNDYNNVVYSSNGTTWNSPTYPAFTTSGNRYGLVWDPVHSVFVTLLGNGNYTITDTSPDAITWTEHATAMPVGQYWSGLATDGAGNIIAVAGNSSGSKNSTAALSTNGGTSFTSLTLPSTQWWINIGYGNGAWYAVTFVSGGGAVSYDTGSTWTADSSLTSADYNFISYGDGVFIAGCANSDYTDATFVEVSAFLSTGSSPTVNYANYTKIGRLVTLEFDFTYPTNTDSGTAKVSGFPYASASGVAGVGICTIGTTSKMCGAYTAPTDSTKLMFTQKGIALASGTYAGNTNAQLSGAKVMGSLKYSV